MGDLTGTSFPARCAHTNVFNNRAPIRSRAHILIMAVIVRRVIKSSCAFSLTAVCTARLLWLVRANNSARLLQFDWRLAVYNMRSAL